MTISTAPPSDFQAGDTLPAPSFLEARVAARRGALEMLPLLAGYVPFALVIGSAAAASGAPLAGWAGSWLIFGGSAHLAAIRTLTHDGPLAAILTALLIHTRLLVYSASLAGRWAGQPRWFRVVASPLIIDPTWAAAERYAAGDPSLAQQRGYFLGSGLMLGVGWSAAIAAGALLGARLDSVDLRIAVPLCLLALIGGGLRDEATRPVIAVAAVVAALTAHWTAGTGLLLAVVAGCLTGSVTASAEEGSATDGRSR
jgi:predicted branched-subunit amino acid permease